MIRILGLDIGGANVKAAGLEYENGETRSLRPASLPFEIWREKERLPEILRTALGDVFPGETPQAAAVTMTAELSDVFASKREGVGFVLDSLALSYPGIETYILSLQGEFVSLAEARQRPLDFAASNWLATAQLVGQTHPDCLLIDVGTTTTDIIPILKGRVVARGRTDLERLTAGELIYTGALRTHLAAIVQAVPVRGASCRVSSEYFCHQRGRAPHSGLPAGERVFLPNAGRAGTIARKRAGEAGAPGLRRPRDAGGRRDRRDGPLHLRPAGRSDRRWAPPGALANPWRAQPAGARGGFGRISGAGSRAAPGSRRFRSECQLGLSRFGRGAEPGGGPVIRRMGLHATRYRL